MANRILRAELLESEAWLALKDNADRCAFIACILTVDTLGDMPAGPQRLVRLWRPYGIDTPDKASKAFADLIDVDLLRRYVVDDKPYLHLPRFRQSRRFLGHVWPLSPWATDEEKQAFSKKSQVIHKSPPVIHREPPIGVGVGVGVGEKQKPKDIVRSNGTTAPAGFLAFWLAWPTNPRKVNRKGCLGIWLKAQLEPIAAVIAGHIEAMRNTEQWREFCPAPATYLNQRRWEDGAPVLATIVKRVAL